jgi:hypothetical protein
VKLHVSSCNICSINKKAFVKPKAALGKFHAGSKLEKVHIDVLGNFTPSLKKNEYILMIVDQFTKWVECYALPRVGAEDIAKVFVNEFVARFSFPLKVHTAQLGNAHNC